MLRKFVLAATMALGLGGGLAATHSADAAVMQTGAGAAVAGTVGPAAPAVTPVYYYGYRYHYRCRWVYRRVYRPYYGWVTVRKRVCW